MKTYDFSKRKRGPALSVPPGKERITIRLDTDVLNYFRDQVERAGGGNYQTPINNALRAYVEGETKPTLEGGVDQMVRLRRFSIACLATSSGEARPPPLRKTRYASPDFRSAATLSFVICSVVGPKKLTKISRVAGSR